MNKKDLRYLKTEKNIKDSFILLINKMGYDKVTISEICRQSLISRNTFYMHYETIEDLIGSIYDDIELYFYKTSPTSYDIKKLTKWYVDAIDNNRETISCLLKCPSLHFKDILFNCVIYRPLSKQFANLDIFIQNIYIKINIEYILNAAISYTEYWLENYNAISKEYVYKDLYELCNEPINKLHQKLNSLLSDD